MGRLRRHRDCQEEWAPVGPYYQGVLGPLCLWKGTEELLSRSQIFGRPALHFYYETSLNHFPF